MSEPLTNAPETPRTCPRCGTELQLGRGTYDGLPNVPLWLCHGLTCTYAVRAYDPRDEA